MSAAGGGVPEPASLGVGTKRRSGAADEGQKKKKEKKNNPEKRLSKFRAQPNQDTLARIERALSQRLYLVDRHVGEDRQQQKFAVLGSTGNIYDVVIRQLPSCTCPDNARDKLCKHILFVFLRVLRVTSSNPVIWQKALLTSELQDIFAAAPSVLAHAAPLASAAVRSTYSQVSGGVKDESLADTIVGGATTQRKEVAGPCPICFEDMVEPGSGGGSGKCPAEETVWCEATCGQSLHASCFTQAEILSPSSILICIVSILGH